jgi:2-octaprenyl-6-methoxyphenol hydroxylase
LLEIEDLKQGLHGIGHGGTSGGRGRDARLKRARQGRLAPRRRAASYAANEVRNVTTDERLDLVVAGAGVAGLALAAALGRALGSGFRIAVCDPALLTTVGAWQRLNAAQPIREMKITDSRLEDVVRPEYLSFAGEVAEDEPFAHMVENRALNRALREVATELSVRLVRSPVESFAAEADAIEIQADGSPLRARLLVAADGARSKLRALAGITTVSWSYGQLGIVCTVAHEREHGGRAEQHFLPGGPFAILPLVGRRSSIVWTEPAAEAERLIALPKQEFHGELERRFGLKLGEIEVVSPPQAHRIEFSMARSFVADRFALLGDAAHVIHPIAGQGLNLGLRDAAALAECVADAARLGLDPGAAPTLDRYERWRRFDTLAMGIATDGLNRLFANRSDALRLARDVGLGIVDRLPALKDFFAGEAAGLSGEAPKLLRGEAL